MSLYLHWGESCDFKITTMADTIEKKTPSIQARLSLIFSLILVRFAWGLKQIPRKNDSKMPIICNIRRKIWLNSYWQATEKFDCLSKLLTRSLSESRKRWTRCYHLKGYLLQTPSQSDQYWLKYQRKSYLNCIEGFWQVSPIFNHLKSCDSPLWSRHMNKIKTAKNTRIKLSWYQNKRYKLACTII